MDLGYRKFTVTEYPRECYGQFALDLGTPAPPPAKYVYQVTVIGEKIRICHGVMRVPGRRLLRLDFPNRRLFRFGSAHSDSLDMVVALAVTREPVDFQALDDQPVRIIFLLIGVESRVGTYLKILSRARILMSSASFRKRILQATTSQAVIEAFVEEEERYFETT